MVEIKKERHKRVLSIKQVSFAVKTKGVRTFLFVLLFTRFALQGIACYILQMYVRTYGIIISIILSANRKTLHYMSERRRENAGNEQNA